MTYDNEKYYLKAGKASDFNRNKDKTLYKFFEMLPGTLDWGTIFGIVLISVFFPLFASFFIIAFDLYWLIKTGVLSFHLRASHKQMNKNLSVNWPEMLDKLSPSEYKIDISHWSGIYHLIILPFFKEPVEVVRDSIAAILKSDISAKNNFILVLGIEERAGKDAQETAQKLKKEFGEKFFRFLITIHPDNISGED